MTNENGDILFVTTAPAPIIENAPIVIPHRMTAPAPREHPFSSSVGTLVHFLFPTLGK